MRNDDQGPCPRRPGIQAWRTAPGAAKAQRKAYIILDGTLIATDRLSGDNDRLFYSGKHRRHGMNMQLLTNPHGELVGASSALPGSVHDLPPLAGLEWLELPMTKVHSSPKCAWIGLAHEA